MFSWMSKIVDRLFVVAGALLFSQTPLFMQSYSHQLQGHVSELNLQIAAMRKVASHSGKSLEQYIGKFLQSPDADFSSQGQLMQGMMDRYNHLSESLLALQNATVWEKPFLFLKNFNTDIAKATWNSYEIGIPLTLEGAAFAALGMGLGYLFFLTLKKLSLTFKNALFRRKEVVVQK